MTSAEFVRLARNAFERLLDAPPAVRRRASRRHQSDLRFGRGWLTTTKQRLFSCTYYVLCN